MPPTTWIFNPFSIPLLLTSIVGVLLIVYSLLRRHVVAAFSFAVVCLFTVIWTTAAVFQLSTQDLGIALTTLKLQQIGYTGIGPSWFVFALAFTRRESWLTRGRIAAIYALPAVMLALFWTNDLHGLMFTNPVLRTGSMGADLGLEWQALFWLHAAIAYALVLGATGMIINHARRSDRVYRPQFIGLVAAAIVPSAANIITLVGVNPLPIDLTPLAFGISIVGFAVTIFQFQMFDLVPLTYERLLGTLREGVIVLDPHDRIVQANTAAVQFMRQPSAKDVIGRPVLELFAPWKGEILPFLTGGDTEGELRIELSTGEAVWFAVRISAIIDARDRHPVVQGKVVVLAEITARKQNELALAEARDQALELDQFKTQVLSNISHDFRTPLASIAGYAELLKDGYFPPNSEAQANAFSAILESTTYLNELVTQLLDKSQLSAGRQMIEYAPISPAEIARTTLERVAILAETKGLACELVIGPDVPVTVLGDRARTQQIITNLMGNAIKFTDQGKVTLRITRPTTNEWEIQVADTGRGIPADQRDVIFEPFRQLSGPTGERRRGFGLGLAIVKDIVTMLDGTIHVESVVGQGSTFIVRLPILPISPGQATSAPPHP